MIFDKPKFKKGDQVHKQPTAVSVGWTGKIWQVHRKGWLFRTYNYEVIPNTSVAGSRHQLLAHEEELESLRFCWECDKYAPPKPEEGPCRNCGAMQ